MNNIMVMKVSKTIEIDDETYDNLVWMGERSGGLEPPEVVKRLFDFHQAAMGLVKSMDG